MIPAKKKQVKRQKGKAGRKRRPRSSQVDKKLRSVPVAQGFVVRTNKPVFRTLPNGDAIVKHREYIGDVFGANSAPSDFEVTGFPINPGQPATFPWLSRIAINYESYIFENLAFSYETMAKTSLEGTVMLTVDYDAQDPPPASKLAAAMYRNTERASPWENCKHVSDSKDLHKLSSNFVRPGIQPPGTDIKTYDIGNFYVITQGMDVKNATCGELYVEYSVKLLTPVYENPATTIYAGGTAVGAGTMSAENPFGDSLAHVTPESYGILVDNASNFIFAFPGTYLVSAVVQGTTMDELNLTSNGPSCVVVSFITVVNAATTAVSRSWAVRILAPGGSALLDANGATTVTQAICWVGGAPLGSIV